MNNVYRTATPRSRTAGSSRFFTGLKIFALLVAAVGIFVLAVYLFRRDAAPTLPRDSAEESVQDADVGATDAVGLVVPEQSSVTLAAVEGETGGATATRSHAAGTYTLSIVADLPPIDGAASAYEAWFVTPGITDFFSLGELFPREDGKWGLVWTQTDALVRSDIAEFTRVIVIREPRDGNNGPSADHVLNGVFE